jgi:aspartyl-tRNA(Asn)/glutamyl-tRNA(Gln) amidotransferase subunit C
MSINDEEIKKLASLSRLDLSEQERKEINADLKEILGLAEKINEVDTTGVEPTYHALPLNNVMRDDEERPSPDPQKVLKYAPESSDGFFVVPQVIEEQ